MRKFLLSIFVFAMCFVWGCCAGQPLPDGTMEKSFSNCVGLAAEKVCGFDAATSQEAQNSINFISMFAPLVNVSGVSLSADTAKTILNQVVTAAQKGGCVLLKDLQQALQFFDALSTQVQTSQKRMKKAMEVPDMTMLRVKARM